MNCLVSIIIPIYNREHIIQETLASVLEQTYTNWECIIVDDRSKDNSLIKIRSIIEGDSRFKLLERPLNRIKGASVCRNIGLENAKGEFIQFLDSDDIISKNKLSSQVYLLEKEKLNCIATCKWGRFKTEITDNVIYDDLDSYKDFFIMENFLDKLTKSKGYFPIHAYLIKRSLIKKSGHWNEKLTLNDDGEFMMRLIPYTDKVLFSNEAIVYYRFGDENNLSNYSDESIVNDAINSWKMIEAYFKIMFKNQSISYIEYIKEALFVNINKTFPDLILKHPAFFSKQLENRKLKNRIKRKLNL